MGYKKPIEAITNFSHTNYISEKKMPDRMDIAKTNNFMQINRSSFREITTNFSPCSSDGVQTPPNEEEEEIYPLKERMTTKFTARLLPRSDMIDKRKKSLFGVLKLSDAFKMKRFS